MRGEASGSRLAASHAAFSGAGAPAAGAWWPGSHLVGISANVMLLCCCFENNEALLSLCQNKVFCTAWTRLDFCTHSEGSGKGWRKAPRKCSNGLGPGDRFYCAWVGCAGLSKTGALNWALVLLGGRLCTHGVSHNSEINSMLQQQLLLQSLSEPSLDIWKHAAPSIRWKLFLETSLWFTIQPATSSGNNLSWGLKAPLHCTPGSVKLNQLVCATGLSAQAKIAPYHSRQTLSNMTLY